MKNISDHITYKESIRSRTGLRRGLDNTPNSFQIHCMQDIAYNLFEPLRSWVGGPIKVNSFFRGKLVNDAVGGSDTSQHMKGQAIDIDDTFGHKTNAEMYRYIRDYMDFDQMVWEFGDDENPDWVHVSWVSHRHNRKKLTIARIINGETVYTNERHE